MNLEIEKKYLVNVDNLNRDFISFKNDIVSKDKYHIDQGYFVLNIKENKNPVTFRLRKVTYSDSRIEAFITFKFPIESNGNFIRKEFEYKLSDVTEQDIEFLLNSANFKISKDRFDVIYKNHVWSLDFYNDFDLAIAEIELKDKDEKFEILPSCEVDLTEDKDLSDIFSNYSLAQYTFDDELKNKIKELVKKLLNRC